MGKKKKHNRKAKEKQSAAEKETERMTSHVEDNDTDRADALTGGATAATGSGALTGQEDGLEHLTGGAEINDHDETEEDEESTAHNYDEAEQEGR